MAESSLLERLDGIDARFEEVSTLITDPAVISDMKRYVRLTREYSELEKLIKATNRYKNALDDIDGAKQILESGGTGSFAGTRRGDKTAVNPGGSGGRKKCDCRD